MAFGLEILNLSGSENIISWKILLITLEYVFWIKESWEDVQYEIMFSACVHDSSFDVNAIKERCEIVYEHRVNVLKCGVPHHISHTTLSKILSNRQFDKV